MFAFHNLAFAFWNIMVDPRIVPSDNASKKTITFVTTVVQLALADCQTAALLRVVLELILHKLYETLVSLR
jgi:hypothetical protein